MTVKELVIRLLQDYEPYATVQFLERGDSDYHDIRLLEYHPHTPDHAVISIKEAK